MRRGLIILALVVVPLGYLLYPAVADAGPPVVILMALLIEGGLILVVFGGWRVRSYFVNRARTDLANAQSASAFSCHLDAQSFRWVKGELPNKALVFWAATSLCALVTRTGFELWWASTIVPPQRLFSAEWNEIDHVSTYGHWPRQARVRLSFKAERPPLGLWVEHDSLLPSRDGQLQAVITSPGIARP